MSEDSEYSVKSEKLKGKERFEKKEDAEKGGNVGGTTHAWSC